MSRNYAGFADLCMMTSGGQPWALDMRQRTGNPALLAYLVNSTCALLVEGVAITENFQRTPQGLMVAQAGGSGSAMAPAALVLLALRFIKGKMIEDGVWRPGISQQIISTCPELAHAQAGEVIAPSAAAHWVTPLVKGEWLVTPDMAPAPAPGVEVDYVRAR
jgi:hypothetical protein